MRTEEEDGMGFAGLCATDATEERCWKELGERNGQLIDAQAEIVRLQDALKSIEQWSRAYPLTVFPEPDFKRAAELLKAGGMTLDAISASTIRHAIEGVGQIARDALA